MKYTALFRKCSGEKQKYHQFFFQLSHSSYVENETCSFYCCMV